MGVARASFYRQLPVWGPPASPAPEPAVPRERPAPARSLSPAERAGVLAALPEERFQDRSPAAVQATLLDEGQYFCSTRTMYRILEQEGESGKRRDQLVHPPYWKPELPATAPHQLWNWDIPKLRGPVKWTGFYLYVILDVFSRYVTGWMVAPKEGAELARQFIEETIGKHQLRTGQLTIHADRGRVMRSKPAAFPMAGLGVTKTHSRPYVSAASKTAAPSASSFSSGTTRSIATPASACGPPAMVHFDEAQSVLAHPQVVLDAAYQAHPDRFVRRPPKPLPWPAEVWIDKPVSPGQKTPEGSP